MAINDHNLNLTEQQYRDLEIPSYSMLSSIEQQGVEVINGVKASFNFKFGSLVDVMCFEPHRVKDLFYMGSTQKPPTSSHKKVVDEIFITATKGSAALKPGLGGLQRRKAIMPKTSELKDFHKEIALTATRQGALTSFSDQKKADTIIKSSSAYFKDMMDSKGKTLIKPEMHAMALETAKTLQTHRFTAKYFNHKTKGIEIIYQYKFDTTVNGKRVKGMLDCLIINHNAKLIIPVDLKTGESVVKDFPMLYTSHRYYIQGALYKEALKSIVADDFDLDGYIVNPFEFVYISKVNVFKPMIFTVGDDLHKAALEGFTDTHGYTYRGVYDLLDDYYDCTERGFCDYTEEETVNKGRVVMDKVLRK